MSEENITIRERTEAIEEEYLSPYASLSKNSKGRAREEAQCDIRPVFQRDRDRILHSKAFRRLKNKTQVFLSPKGDHYRTRLSHTLEVSQNARTIAKALRLNEDLTEAIALGHDLGHTPFGHCGEGVLNELCGGGFIHSEQSVRIVEKLEKDGEGLNLTYEVIDGIRNHQTEGAPSTLEGQVVRLADKIAYVNADVDDAIRAHLISEDDIPRDIREVLGTNVKKRLNTLIHDVIIESAGSPVIKMSEERMEAMLHLREFLFSSVYRNPEAKSEEVKAKRMIAELFHYFMEHFEAVPEKFRRIGERSNEPEDRVVCDYISGMTDDFATQKFAEYFIPKSWEAELD